MHTRCLTAVDLAEHVALQIQFWSLAVKATSDTDLMDISFPSIVQERHAHIQNHNITFLQVTFRAKSSIFIKSFTENRECNGHKNSKIPQ